MKIIEVRIHTIKDKKGNIPPKGIKLAKQIRRILKQNKYAAHICAEPPRCFKTMEYFGFPKYEIDEGFNTLPDEKDLWKPQAKKLEHKYGEFGAFLEIVDPRLQRMIKNTGLRVIRTIKRVANTISDGERVLVVSHGGALIPAIKILKKNFDLGEIGGRLKPCEGIEFYVEGDKIVGFEVLKHSFLSNKES